MSTSSVDIFLDELAARTPTPGGGAGSAIAGAIGAALGEMSAAFTTGNEKFKSIETEVQRLLDTLCDLRKNLRSLADEDAAAYAAWTEARALPKTSEAEKNIRSQRLAESREQSTVVPEKLLSTSLQALQACAELAPICNPNLIADVAVAAQLLEACGRGAFTQILGNLRPKPEDSAAQGRLQSARQQRNQCRTLCASIEKRVVEIMGVQDDT